MSEQISWTQMTIQKNFSLFLWACQFVVKIIPRGKFIFIHKHIVMPSGLKHLVWGRDKLPRPLWAPQQLGPPSLCWESVLTYICWGCCHNGCRLNYSKYSQQLSSEMLLLSHPPAQSVFFPMLSSVLWGVNCKHRSLPLQRGVKWLHLDQATNYGIRDAWNWRRLQRGLPTYAPVWLLRICRLQGYKCPEYTSYQIKILWYKNFFLSFNSESLW